MGERFGMLMEEVRHYLPGPILILVGHGIEQGHKPAFVIHPGGFLRTSPQAWSDQGAM